MVQTPVRPLTLEDFLKLPETKPASEYIEGEIIQKPMPEAAHSVVQGDLTTAIHSVLKSSQKARAFPELRCTFDGRAIVPDVTVFPWPDIPRDDGGMVDGELFAAPNWMIEVLSPGQSQTKLVKKNLHAIDHGTLGCASKKSGFGKITTLNGGVMRWSVPFVSIPKRINTAKLAKVVNDIAALAVSRRSLTVSILCIIVAK